MKNEFAYSGGRYSLYKSCQYAYYLKYYFSHEGWNYGKTNDKHLAWRLKRIHSIPTWMGVHVHDILKEIISKHIQGETLNITQADYLAVEYLSEKFSLSTKGIHAKEKGIVLWEHYKGEVVNFVELVKTLRVYITNFINAVFFPIITKLNVNKILTVDDDTFSQVIYIDGVKVFTIIDFAFFDKGKINIFDWKTGKVESEYSKQLVLYALYFVSKYKKNNLWIENFNLSEFNLTKGLFSPTKLHEYSFSGIVKEVREQIKELSKLLVDGDTSKNELRKDVEFLKNPKYENQCEKCIFLEVCGGA